MKVVILAGGYANRLRSVTNNGEIAKTMLPIYADGQDKPILYHLLEKVERLQSVDEIIIIVNDKYKQQIRDAVNFYQAIKPVSIYSDGSNDPENAKGANVALQIANQHIPADYRGDVMVMASDNYFEFKLEDLISYYEMLKDEFGNNINIIASKEYPDGDREYIAKNFGILNIGEGNKIVGLDEKPGIENLKSNNVSLALYMFNRLDLTLVEDYMQQATGKARDALGYFVNYMINNTDCFTYPVVGKFLDIGTPEEYYKLCSNQNIKK